MNPNVLVWLTAGTVLSLVVLEGAALVASPERATRLKRIQLYLVFAWVSIIFGRMPCVFGGTGNLLFVAFVILTGAIAVHLLRRKLRR